MGVCALDLVFGICEKRFKITISRRDAICKVFENEGESEECSSFYLKIDEMR